MKLFSTYGYTDEEGYLAMQKSLMDFAGDAVVLAYTSAYNYTVLEVCQIDPNQAQLPKV